MGSRSFLPSLHPTALVSRPTSRLNRAVDLFSDAQLNREHCGVKLEHSESQPMPDTRLPAVRNTLLG